MRSLGFVAMLVAAGIGLVAYQRSFTTRGAVPVPPQQQIDTIGIKTDLMSMGASERQYFATRGTYATLEQLAEADLLTGATERRGYVFTAAPDGVRGFTITATPTDSSKSDWPAFTIDETLQVVER